MAAASSEHMALVLLQGHLIERLMYSLSGSSQHCSQSLHNSTLLSAASQLSLTKTAASCNVTMLSSKRLDLFLTFQLTVVAC